MKLIRTITPAIIMLIMFTSCVDFFNVNNEENLSLEKHFKPIEINNEYRMLIPKYMVKAGNLNDEASLQYQNIFKETYIIVIDEDKQNFIDTFKSFGIYNDSLSIVQNYREVQLQSISESIDIIAQTNPKQLIINGMKAEMIDFEGQVEGVSEKIAYLFAFIEGEDKMYLVTAWTLLDRKKKYLSTFEKTIKSFQLID